MNAPHTPGPWIVEPGIHDDPDLDDCDFMIVEQQRGGEVIAAVVGPITLGTSEGNAHLMAGAPLMLAALLEAAAALDLYIATDDSGDTADTWATNLRRVIAGAIAKAEGRS